MFGGTCKNGDFVTQKKKIMEKQFVIHNFEYAI